MKKSKSSSDQTINQNDYAVKDIKTKEDYVANVKWDGLTVIDFYTAWCGPCKRFAPTFEKIANDYPNFKFGKIDCENENLSDIANILKISSVPSFGFFINGQWVKTVSGPDENKIRSLIEAYIKKENSAKT